METIAKRLRDNYISTLNHDLKIPAIAQMRALELLLNENVGSINDVQKEILNSTLESCKCMYDMLNSLSCSYKLENNDYFLNCESTDILELLREEVAIINDFADKKGAKLNLFCSSDRPFAYVDKIQLNNILGKIFNYIISCSTNNSIICELRKSVNKNSVLISIIFQSTYINSENLKKMFCKYTTSEEILDKVGSNLNLYLAKQIIKAHNGSISVRSKKENFNIICIKLPAVEKY